MDGPRRIEHPGVRGWLHLPQGAPRQAIALTHGAGSNCDAALLVALAEAFSKLGWAALRFDLPFRQARPTGPPAGPQARDREGIRLAAERLREMAPAAAVYLGGHSYGGRQTSMLAAEDAGLARALLLLSYPLHPPGQPEKPRTAHFSALRTPALFIHGTRDEFGSTEELEIARLLIPAHTAVEHIESARHGLAAAHARRIAERFVTFTKE